MPNHIKNRLRFSGDKKAIESLIKEYSTSYPSEPNKAYDGRTIYKSTDGEYGWLDEETGVFERRETAAVIGVPEGFSIDMIEAFTRFPDFAKVIPPPNNDAYNDIPDQSAVKDSPDHWYNWNVKHWGTKWNSYGFDKVGDYFFFETAWTGVPNLISVISEKYPSVRIEYDFADEDTGYNVSKHIFENGVGFEHQIAGGSNEAYELAIELRPENSEYYELKDGKYVSKE